MSASKDVKPIDKTNPTMNDDYLACAACNDCTGLIPSVAEDASIVENYENLYPYLPPIPPNPTTGVPDPLLPPQILPDTQLLR